MESQGYFKHHRFLIFFAVLVLQFLATALGCQSTNYIHRDDDRYLKILYPFIEDGRTTRQEVAQKIGYYRKFQEFKSREDTISIYRILDYD